MGPVSALAFVTSLEDPGRFPRNRSAAAFLGLCPKRSQTGQRDPGLRISKTGNPYVRRLLVQCAAHILGRSSVDTALRQWGKALEARGGNGSKKRAQVALARKLAVVLMALFKSEEDYQPFPEHNSAPKDKAA